MVDPIIFRAPIFWRLDTTEHMARVAVARTNTPITEKVFEQQHKQRINRMMIGDLAHRWN